MKIYLMIKNAMLKNEEDATDKVISKLMRGSWYRQMNALPSMITLYVINYDR